MDSVIIDPNPPKFFIPFAKDEEQGERAYAAIRANISANCGELESHRIWQLHYSYKGKSEVATVGEIFERTGGTVIAIFRPVNALDLFYVCTPNRGVVTDGPYYVSGGPMVLFAAGDDHAASELTARPAP